MTNNEFLQALWEGMPGAWLAQYRHSEQPRWTFLSCPSWVDGTEYRLIPAVPEGCEPPPEEAFAYGPDRPGAVCLQGPVVWHNSWCINGWMWDSSWVTGPCGGYLNSPYLLDLSDPNAAEILALNRPDWKLPETGPTPEQRAAMDQLTAEGQERGEYDTTDAAHDLVIPADVMENCDLESLMRGALACGYSIKMIDGGIVGWRDE